MLPKTALQFLCVVLIVSAVIGFPRDVVSAQSSICELLETPPQWVFNAWLWLDAETVVFGVSGHPGCYEFDEAILTELDAPPTASSRSMSGRALSRMTGLAESAPELLALLVEPAPSGDAFVSPRIDASTDWYAYWYTDVETGVQVDLGFSIPTAFSANVVWAAQESHFALQSSINNTVDYPTVYGFIENDNLEVIRLNDVPEFNQVMPPNAGYIVMGLSAEGRYLVIDPQFPPYQMKIFDWQERTWTDLPFKPRGFRRAVVWTAPHEFVAITDAGVVRYNIDTAALEVITEASQLGTPLLNSGVLSPTGHYLIGISLTTETGGETHHIAVCRLG